MDWFGSIGSLLIFPGVNILFGAGALDSSLVAFAISVTNAYNTSNFEKLVKKLADMETQLDKQNEEMTIIKNCIDKMLVNASKIAATKPGQEGHVDSDDDIYNNSEFKE